MSWQKILAQGFSSVAELLEFLSLPANLGSFAAEATFKTRVPRGFATRMQPGNAQDPLLLQVLAEKKEMQQAEGFIHDPLAEGVNNPLQGLIHKYHGRVLLTFTGACAVNCRYCFRRHFSYKDNNPGRKGWQNIFNYIEADKSIQEVILSGGDPLLATDKLLQEFIGQLSSLSQIKTLRFHTRIPIVLPERINNALVALLTNTKLRKIVVLHSNHPQEIDDTVRQGCLALQSAGCYLLNQSVLLKGVNDSAQILAELSDRLFDCGVLPYYLHVLDKVAGATHFDLSLEKALNLHRELQSLLPGYLVPRLVQEIAGKPNKTILA